jgi:hypothetical protein
MQGHTSVCKCHAVLLVFIMMTSSMSIIAVDATVSPKATTVWSGSIFLNDGYNVQNGQILIVQAGTNIFLGDDEEINIDGRISIIGSLTSPVILESLTGNHNGIVFNSTSNGLNSNIDNLTINDSKYGITIYASDPKISNLKVVNADNVAVDLFNGASPIITNLTIVGGGQDVHASSTSWRYGIGLSVGYNSAPLIDGISIDGLITRGINFWGNSGGLLSNINITNITGATLSTSAGIWVEDSIPLLVDVFVNRCDNGIFIRHQTSNWLTRPSFTNIIIENSQYRGVMVEQYNHSQYNNLPTNAIFENLEIRGTGGPNSKTPGLGYAAFDVNTSGVKINGALIENNPVVGFRAYMIDSSTIIENMTMLNNGQISFNSPMNDRAGLYFRSSSWSTKGPAIVNNLIVNNSSGPGVLMMKGGVIGKNWLVSGNEGNGIDFREFHPRVDTIVSQNNGRNGLYIYDSTNVEISNVVTIANGLNQSNPLDGAGIVFHESNIVMSGGKNTSCNSCISSGDNHGIVVRDSIDIQLNSIIIKNSIISPSLDIDNSNVAYFGTVILDDVQIFSNNSDFAVEMIEVDANINNLIINGENHGLSWSSKGIAPSSLFNSIISGFNENCLVLFGHLELIVDNATISCNGSQPVFTNSIVNFTDSILLQDQNATNSFKLISGNHIRWISSSDISPPSVVESDNTVDIMWNIDLQTINQNFMNIPYAEINLSFEFFENELTSIQPYSGRFNYGPFIGSRWSVDQGWSNDNSVNTTCSYDGVTNSTESFILNDDKSIICRLDISNQPPFIIWQLPEKGITHSSNSEIIFDATKSWDLDNDPLSYSWTSDIDGNIISSCGPGQIFNETDNYSFFRANYDYPSGMCALSDGLHIITLQVCDNADHCVNESRQIELLNLPPVLSVGTNPIISSWGTLYLGQTANLTTILSGTYDPEGGDLWCWMEVSYEDYPVSFTEGEPTCPQEIIRDFLGAPNQFTVTVYASDGINSNRTWSFNVELFNEIPLAKMEITRLENTSANIVRLDGSNTIDPEGDDIKFEFNSNLDGILLSGISSSTNIEWSGTLSKGVHNITMKAGDNNPNNLALWTYYHIELEVLNSPPNALINYPNDGLLSESGDLIGFDSSGSGDWDLSCLELPNNGSNLFCNNILNLSDDLVSILWISDKLTNPIGSDWNFETRLPAGNHNISLILNDGYVEVVSNSINIIVVESAPLLILNSPSPNAVVQSNSPVLFDFRNSFDPDGDNFTVSIFSDLMGHILQNKSIDYWYNDYLIAGNHHLTITLKDSNLMQRIYYQDILVQETAPFAEITNLTNGQYIPPGQIVELDSSNSYDYDDDIVLYQWSLNDGTIIGNKEIEMVNFNPGVIQINLMVQDSRGAQDFTSVNLTIGSSYPTLEELIISIDSIKENEATEVYIYVTLNDADGTTKNVNGEVINGGVSQAFTFRDDGKGSDHVSDDNIWTYRTNWEVSDGNWVRVEVWAIDGDSVSQSQIEIIPILKQGNSNSLDWAFKAGLPMLSLLMITFALLGLVYVNNRRIQISKDLELIESWSGFDPRELDQEFDGENNN